MGAIEGLAWVLGLSYVWLLLVNFFSGIAWCVRLYRQRFVTSAARRLLWLYSCSAVEPVVTLIWLVLQTLLISVLFRNTMLDTLWIWLGMLPLPLVGLLVVLPLLQLRTADAVVRSAVLPMLEWGILRTASVFVIDIMVYAAFAADSQVLLCGAVLLLCGCIAVLVQSLRYGEAHAHALLAALDTYQPAVSVGPEGVMITAPNHQSNNQPKIR